MKVQSALLCDAASVREGLLHILGGGLTSLVRPVLPAPLGITLAVVCEVESGDAERRVDFRVVVLRVDGAQEPVLELDGDLGMGEPPHVVTGIPLLLPVVIDLGGLPMPEEGVYAVQVWCDGKIGADLRVSLRIQGALAVAG